MTTAGRIVRATLETAARCLHEATAKARARATFSRQCNAGLARDIGIAESELVAYAVQAIEAAPRMARMRAVFGLAEDSPATERWRSDEMVRACAHCTHKGACDRTLRRPGVTTDDVGFCPNRRHYAELSARAQ